MKLTSIEIRPENVALNTAQTTPPRRGIELSFRDPTSQNPFNVKSVTGLDIDQVVPRSYRSVSRLPTLGGGTTGFFNLSLLKRQVVFKIGLNPDYDENETYSDLRDTLYRLIGTGRTGRVQILFKNRVEIVAVLAGFISKSENPLFEKVQDVTLTIECDEPLLKAPDRVTLIDIPPRAPYEEGDVLIMPTPGEVTSVPDDKSTAPHGFSFIMKIKAPIPSLTIKDPDDDTWTFKILPSGGFLTNDELHFSSEFNSRALYLIRSHVTIQLGDAIFPGSVWPLMFPGMNTFSFDHDNSLEMVELWYYPTYWGV